MTKQEKDAIRARDRVLIYPSGTAADRRALLRECDRLEAACRWVPVTERMPPNGLDVLITVDSCEFGPRVTWGTANCSSDGRWWGFRGHNLDGVRVIAWMPLPAPWEPQP